MDIHVHMELRSVETGKLITSKAFNTTSEELFGRAGSHRGETTLPIGLGIMGHTLTITVFEFPEEGSNAETME